VQNRDLSLPGRRTVNFWRGAGQSIPSVCFDELPMDWIQFERSGGKWTVLFSQETPWRDDFPQPERLMDDRHRSMASKKEMELS